MLTKKKIKERLNEAGFGPGNLVMLHSDFFCMGPVEGGVDTIIDAFLEVLGKDGTLVMPTFTLSAPFNFEKSRSECGFITEKFRTMKGVLRSFHPTHSVAALGPLAEKIVRDHDKTSGTGRHSPFHKLAQLNGKICLITTDKKFYATIIHTAQILANCPYTHLRIKKEVYNSNKKLEIIKLKENPVGCNEVDLNFKAFLSNEGLLQKIPLGNAFLYCFDASKFLKYTVKTLKSYPLAFSCSNPSCKSCTYMRWKSGKESCFRFYWLNVKDKFIKFELSFHKLFK